MNHLEEARKSIQRANESAGGVVQRQLHSIDDGIFQEESGDKTQGEPGPKVDRIVEVAEKLEALEDEAEKPETRDRIEDAHNHLRAYLRQHPQGGYPEEE